MSGERFKEFSFDLVWIYHRFRVCATPTLQGGRRAGGRRRRGYFFTLSPTPEHLMEVRHR
jgi:hypothetical protein